jgi:hypothetical protein
MRPLAGPEGPTKPFRRPYSGSLAASEAVLGLPRPLGGGPWLGVACPGIAGGRRCPHSVSQARIDRPGDKRRALN